MVGDGSDGMCVCVHIHTEIGKRPQLDPIMSDKKKRLPITNYKTWVKFIFRVSFCFFIKSRYEK